MNINESIQLAHEHHLAGNLEQAEYLYRHILNIQPANANVYNDFGNLLQEKETLDEAIICYRKAIELNPHFAGAYHNLGETLQDKGQFDEAIDCYKKVIELLPDFVGSYYNLGVILQEINQLDKALIYYEKALQLDPHYADTFNNIGIILRDKGKFAESIDYFNKAIELNPNFANAYFNLAYVLQEKGQLNEAIACYQKALTLNPNYADACNNLGNTFKKKGQLDEAIACYQKALTLNPNDADACNNLGNAFKEKGQLDEAIACYQKALTLNPNYAVAYYNLGNTFKEKGQLDEAIACYQKALTLNPNDADACNNLGNAFKEKGQLDEAMSYYENALHVDPNNAEAHWNMSLLLLLLGNFKQGWKGYEIRFKLNKFPRRYFSQPLWDGSDIRGRTILLHSEQGFGDAIQFIRYARLVAQSGAKVIIKCQKALTSLFQNIEGMEKVVTHGDPLPDFDMHCSLLSLPLILNTNSENIPNEIPYISVDAELTNRWKDKSLQKNADVKIGLAWAGNPTLKGDRFRTCSLEMFSPFACLDNITFYSLQKGNAAEQTKHASEEMKLIDLTEDIHDFSDTAALIENLDLVISVDTAVAHLAGALGKPVWTLLPFAPDWRWLLTREDSPWYPTMRLFRQPSFGDWDSVIEKVRDELLNLLSKH
jgi:tetratricopeptide (TPR) repeat protein